MATKCIQPSVPTPPPLPSQFSIPDPPLPGPPMVGVCCQIDPLDYIIGPIQPPFVWPGPVNAGVIVAINAGVVAATQAINNWLDGIVPDCPKG